ncbi:hypothetical protein BKA70DRAFT_599502 [Coprinopsis sp. MPI-PUGE-AT-0042]|nr:hypothetical protein BKA70DRAFT_599502 [Coprinopsis sp. MPI-PUGE-AT-0042]
MSGIFNRMLRLARRTARQAWGTVTRFTSPVIRFFRTRWPWSWQKTLMYLASLGLIGAGLALLHPHVLPALGFAAAGILAGSLAARIQSVFFGGYTTSPFSCFQSLGARAAVPAIGTAIPGGFLFGLGVIIFCVAWNMS